MNLDFKIAIIKTIKLISTVTNIISKESTIITIIITMINSNSLTTSLKMCIMIPEMSAECSIIQKREEITTNCTKIKIIPIMIVEIIKITIR